MTHLRPVVKALIRRPLYATAIVLVTAVGFTMPYRAWLEHVTPPDLA